MNTWDPERTAEFYDEYGEQEWTRFETGRTPAAGYDIHLRFLERFVQPGQRVLDAGSGPGRFTLELVRLGADVVALDISPGQLEQLRRRLPDVETHVGDVTDLSRFADDSFDVTICFGGPLSYVLDRGEDALAELVRITRPGGHVLVSVMSLVGAIAHYISILADLARRDGAEKQLEIARTGFLPEEPDYGHLAMKMYRWSELEAMLAQHGEIVGAAAAGLIPDPRPEEPELREMIHALEAELCEEPGAISSGQHIVAALRVAALPSAE
jgi:ubiquinone/menaquinone biosynthesis C-methylase UbiE